METNGTKNGQMSVQKTHGKIKATCRSQAKGLTVTSACNLGEACHLALCLLHAVIAQKVALSQQARMHQVPSLLSAQPTTVELQRVFYAPPGDFIKSMKTSRRVDDGLRVGSGGA